MEFTDVPQITSWWGTETKADHTNKTESPVRTYEKVEADTIALSAEHVKRILDLSPEMQEKELEALFGTVGPATVLAVDLHLVWALVAGPEGVIPLTRAKSKLEMIPDEVAEEWRGSQGGVVSYEGEYGIGIGGISYSVKRHPERKRFGTAGDPEKILFAHSTRAKEYFERDGALVTVKELVELTTGAFIRLPVDYYEHELQRKEMIFPGTNTRQVLNVGPDQGMYLMHKLLLKLFDGDYYLATSMNRTGEPSVTTFQESTEFFRVSPDVSKRIYIKDIPPVPLGKRGSFPILELVFEEGGAHPTVVLARPGPGALQMCNSLTEKGFTVTIPQDPDGERNFEDKLKGLIRSNTEIVYNDDGQQRKVSAVTEYLELASLFDIDLET